MRPSEPQETNNPDKASEPLTPEQKRRQKLRHAVRFFYDLQKLRIQSGNRTGTEQVELDKDDQAFMDATSLGLEALEKRALKEVRRYLKGVPIYESWLKHQKGCGPTMAGVIVSEIDVSRCDTMSALWAYAGLVVSTETGKAVRRQKGVKSNWNPFLKTKLVGVLGGCFLKANSPWREHYDNRKHRQQSKGWGQSDGHRHSDAIRVMVKHFLGDLWLHWRELEGLPITLPYGQAKLGVIHGEHQAV
jgi:hypothetical protein